MGVGTLASPVAIAGRDEDYAGIELFKRDAVLTPRDFELAEVHGVNLTESTSDIDSSPFAHVNYHHAR